jgi:hypothetical protein
MLGVPSFLCYLFLHLFTLNKKNPDSIKKKYLKNRKLYDPFLEVDDVIENTVSYVNIKYGNSFFYSLNLKSNVRQSNTKKS